MPQRQTTFALKGLVTTPNEYGVFPEGSFSFVRNILCRSMNEWTLARDPVPVVSSGVAGQRPHRVIWLSSNVFMTINCDAATYTTWTMYLNGSSSTAFTVNSPLSLSSLFDAAGALTPTLMRNRLFLNSRQGVLVLDKLAPATAGERVLRLAGLPQPSWYTIASSAGDAIPAYTTVSYACIIRRVTADGYVMTSPPTMAIRFVNGATSCQNDVNVQWAETSDFQDGDVLELYRSAGLPNVTADQSIDSGTSMRLVGTHTIDATDLSLKTATVTDRRLMTAPLYETEGVEIYTSPYQDGSTGANLPPPVCKTTAQWGRYTFYGNITDDPSWTMDIPGGHLAGDLAGLETAWMRQYGVGRRFFRGDQSTGSPTITAISAADMVGLKVGQSLTNGSGFAGPPTVVSIGASSVTLSANSTVTATNAIFATVDVLDISSTVLGMYSLLEAAVNSQFALGHNMAVFPSETIPTFGGSQREYSAGTTILVRPKRSGVFPTFTVRGTNGQNYSPPIPDLAATAQTLGQTERPNLLRWSKSNQPEAVPTPNEAFVGSGSIMRLLPTTDCLWVLTTEGAYRLTGEAGVWRTDLIDPGFIPVCPSACCVLNEVVYAYTANRGFCSISSGGGTALISRGVIDDVFPTLQPSTDAQYKITLYANPVNEEILFIKEAAVGGANDTYIYSVLYKQWTQYLPSGWTDPSKNISCADTFYPAVGSKPYTIFGIYNSASPAVVKWDDPAEPGKCPFPYPYFDLQPVYAGDPMLVKQWINSTLICGPVDPNSDIVSVTTYQLPGIPAGSGDLVNSRPGVSNATDSRVTLGIPRAIAIGTTIKLRYLILQDVFGVQTPRVIKGLSFLYNALTTQQRYR